MYPVVNVTRQWKMRGKVIPSRLATCKSSYHSQLACITSVHEPTTDAYDPRALIAPDNYDPEVPMEPHEFWVGSIRDVRARGPEDVSTYSAPSVPDHRLSYNAGMGESAMVLVGRGCGWIHEQVLVSTICKFTTEC